MRALILAFFAAMTGLGVATAGEEEKKIEIKVVKSGTAGDTDVHWVGDGADLDGLAVGESKTLDDGVVVSRTEDGMTIDVDGEQIVLPDMGEHGQHMAFVDADHGEGDVDVRVIRKSHGKHKRHAMHRRHDGIMIASDAEIDAATQETIRSVLATAGYADEVRFVQPGERRVKVMRKQVEITE